MKICILNVLHDALDKRMYHKIARSLSAASHEIVSIAPPAAFAAGRNQAESGETSVRFVFTPAVHSFFGRLLTVLRLIRLGLREKATLYIAPEPESWVAALLIKAATGRKVAFDMHEYVPGEFAKFFPSFLRPPMEKTTCRIMRLMGRASDLIILTRRSFEPLWSGIRTPRVVVINSNWLQPACTAVPDAVRKIAGERPTVLHQGIFGEIRGSLQLLEAMKLVKEVLPEVRCLVLGRYVYGDESAYRQKIKESGLEDTLLLLDEVPFEEVPAYISAVQVGLILFQPGLRNHELAMPHKLFDYMREGVPVIAPDFAVEVAHIVKETQCGLLVDVTSPDAIADAVIRLLTNPDEAQRFGRHGREAVESKYNWQKDSAALVDAIAALE